jgi:catechol 2,3-dioxygenase-like lactoylglutathione lyase family enzyme
VITAGGAPLVAARKIGHVALLVRNYDEAIAFSTTCLRFTLLEDTAAHDFQMER